MDVVLGTAGHIDHGKTSLVRALTGINCDRLDEEKRRGITIELGFAWLDLPDGRRLGIVDVPGHERFVKNMVAGASGIDCMLLVIAADEGVMPQTREHLDICALLGVRHGLVALTKCDMVEPAWLEMVKDDVAQCLEGSFLAGAPILPVSSVTGAGLEELKKAIEEMVARLPQQRRTDILRLPVDRVFTLKGFGTVVTGTLTSGACQEGEDVQIMPKAIPARARSLQVHGQQVKEAHQGQRCAMNLQGVDVEQIERGDVIARAGTLFPSRRWVVRLTCLASSPLPIRQRMEAHFHHGSRECAARVVFRDRMELAPGQTALAEIHFRESLAAIFGDRCVLRAHSPLRAVAGGIVIDPLPPLLRKRDPLFARKFATLEELGELAANGVDSAEATARLTDLVLSLRPAPGANERRLAALTGLRAHKLTAALQNLASRGKAILWDATARCWTDKDSFSASVQQACARAKELHEREPLKVSFAAAALLAGWGEELPPKYSQRALEEGIKNGQLAQEANGLRLAAHQTALSARQAGLLAQIQEIYENASYSPPTLRELQEQTGADGKILLALATHLCETGQLVKIQEGLYYNKNALGEIMSKAHEWFAQNEKLDVGGMKTILGVTRKYAIPLLEYMDAIRMTYRAGNERKLRK